MRANGGRTTFDLKLEPVTIALDRAMPFALILSEVVTNAIKHALEESAGTIVIDLTAHKGVAKLTVSDNGTGAEPRGRRPRIRTAPGRQPERPARRRHELRTRGRDDVSDDVSGGVKREGGAVSDETVAGSLPAALIATVASET